jgi:hypothetical protein
MLLLLLKGRRLDHAGVGPALGRDPSIGEENEDDDGDHEEPDEGFEHGDETFDVFVVLVFLLVV